MLQYICLTSQHDYVTVNSLSSGVTLKEFSERTDVLINMELITKHFDAYIVTKKGLLVANTIKTIQSIFNIKRIGLYGKF